MNINRLPCWASRKGENLFLDSGRWDAHYLPGIIARGPFLIGFQERFADGERREEPVIHVDLDNPRVSFTEGRPVFLPAGGNSSYLNQITAVLRGIHQGMDMSKAMFAEFTALGLIEPIKLEVKLNDEETFNLAGLHTISQEKLRCARQRITLPPAPFRVSAMCLSRACLREQREQAHDHEAAKAARGS